MHIYKGKYAVLAPFWSIKRKQGRNWRTIIFILWFPTLLLISWHSLTLFSHLFVSLFELLKALWAVGWKHFPKCSLFIYCIREAKGPRAGCIYETRWQVEGPAESGREMKDIILETVSVGGEGGSSGNMNCPSHSHFFCPRMQCNIDCGSDNKIGGNLINTLCNPLRRSEVIRRNSPRWTFQHVEDAVSLT